MDFQLQIYMYVINLHYTQCECSRVSNQIQIHSSNTGVHPIYQRLFMCGRRHLRHKTWHENIREFVQYSECFSNSSFQPPVTANKLKDNDQGS